MNRRVRNILIIPTMLHLMRIDVEQRSRRLYQGVMPFSDYAAKLSDYSSPE